MKPEELAAVDIFKHLRVLRHVTDGKVEEQAPLSEESVTNDGHGNKCTSVTNGSTKPAALNKKSLNIPICDVQIDPDYEKNVTPTFVQSVPYIKYVRRVGDDTDITTDYQCDKDDENYLFNSLLVKFPDEKSKFTMEKLEMVMNIFERANGTVRDTLPQGAAMKAVSEKSGLDISTISKLTQDIYKYWVTKRDKLGKPLSRKYWPPTLANDTNPHQVFRVRDRERYKLRRQHRRNDMDSFRKMQQLRKEFQQAKTILQLVLERELLTEAQFRVQREMFDQKVFELNQQRLCPEGSNTDTTTTTQVVKRRKEKSFSYDPFFKHLWMQQPVNFTSAAASVDGKTSDGEGDIADDLSASVDNTQPLKRAGRPPKTGGALIVEPAPPAATTTKGATATVEKKKKKATPKDKTTLYTVNAEGEVEILPFTETAAVEPPAVPPTVATGRKTTVTPADYLHSINEIPYAGYLQSSIFDTSDQIAALAKDGSAIIHEDVEGPPYVCRPYYPHFLYPLPSREQVYSYCTPTEYLTSLEYKYDDSYEPVAPMKYKARCRVGRGGRLVIDRVPIYPDGPDNDESAYGDPANHYVYQYPVSLRPHQHWVGTSKKDSSKPNMMNPTSTATIATTALSGDANNTNNNNNNSGSSNINNSNNNNNVTTVSEEPTKTMKAGSKLLPDVPISNRKLFMQYARRSGRNGLPNQNVWASSLPIAFPSVPPLAPPPRIGMNPDKISKLASILAESDSEDERIVIPKSTEGFEIDRNTNSKTAASEHAMTKILMSVGGR